METKADVLVNCVGSNDKTLDGCGAVAKVMTWLKHRYFISHLIYVTFE